MAISSLDAADGGPPQAVLPLACALRDLGHEITIVSHRHHRAALHALVPVAAARGVRIVWVPRRKATRFQFSPRLLLASLRSAKGADVVVAHGFYQFTCVAAYLASRARRSGLWVQPHGVFEPFQEQQSSRAKAIFRATLGRLVLRGSDTLVATADSEAHGIRTTLGTWARPILVAGLGVDVGDAPGGDSTRWTSRNVLFLSRLAPKKRLDKLIAAAALLAERGRPVQLTVCGDGVPALVEELKAQAVACGVTIEWPGHVSGEVRRALESTHAVFCLPSDNENFAQAVTEAMAAGLPVITTRATGACVHVERAHAGWVADDPTIEDLADLLDDALGDPARLAVMSRRGREYVERELTWPTVAARWADRAEAGA